MNNEQGMRGISNIEIRVVANGVPHYFTSSLIIPCSIFDIPLIL